MQVSRIASFEEWSSLAPAWNFLTRGVPFRGWEWLSSWQRHFADESDLYVLAVRDDRGELVGAAPWRRQEVPLRGRVLSFLGSGTVCSDYMSLLATVEHEDAVARAIADWLIEAAKGAGAADRWDSLELSGVATGDPAVDKLADYLLHGGCAVYRRQGIACWRIDLPGDWEEYLAGLSKSHRKQVRRLDRRFTEAKEAVLRTAGSPDEVAFGMKVLVDLHQRRRRSLGEPGCFADERFSAFLHEAASRLWEADALRLHWIELHGKPIAAEFHLAGKDGAYAYQAGVDPDALDDEPGRLITVATLRQAIEEGLRWFDFLRGDEPYKAHFRAAPVECQETHVSSPRAASHIRHGVWAAGDAVKHLVKLGLGLTKTT
jgi:CelD/BcsL family acetyltransferase involved in cellulose biosynthesis